MAMLIDFSATEILYNWRLVTGPISIGAATLLLVLACLTWGHVSKLSPRQKKLVVLAPGILLFAAMKLPSFAVVYESGFCAAVIFSFGGMAFSVDSWRLGHRAWGGIMFSVFLVRLGLLCYSFWDYPAYIRCHDLNVDPSLLAAAAVFLLLVYLARLPIPTLTPGKRALVILGPLLPLAAIVVVGLIASCFHKFFSTVSLGYGANLIIVVAGTALSFNSYRLGYRLWGTTMFAVYFLLLSLLA